MTMARWMKLLMMMLLLLKTMAMVGLFKTAMLVGSDSWGGAVYELTWLGCNGSLC